jgi:hypothetical protein
MDRTGYIPNWLDQWEVVPELSFGDQLLSFCLLYDFQIIEFTAQVLIKDF